MYRENYIKSLRKELLALVEDHLTPVALAYSYSETPLESNIKWRPQVLVLGNYSSGKSTLINEFLGAKIQGTGQAPTDDSFTIITYDDSQDAGSGIRVTETRDGKYLLNDPEYPFEALKRHGQRFSAHFRMKKVTSPFLRTLTIIDTPGMLDSITERDRGYNYQDVIGDLAQISDLVLILFDPHKAGTVREAHASLRDTLPAKTFEDRVLFVLNRIDECASLTDLLRVYGTLCWNLSQMTGRKDIPMIHLTYSPSAAERAETTKTETAGYLEFLENQREDLKKAILQAPKHRLDNLAAFVETHSERLSHLLEALVNYRLRLRAHRFKAWLTAILFSLLAGGGIRGSDALKSRFCRHGPPDDRRRGRRGGGGGAAAVVHDHPAGVHAAVPSATIGQYRHLDPLGKPNKAGYVAKRQRRGQDISRKNRRAVFHAPCPQGPGQRAAGVSAGLQGDPGGPQRIGHHPPRRPGAGQRPRAGRGLLPEKRNRLTPTGLRLEKSCGRG
jgi:EH domain-containing protein 1